MAKMTWDRLKRFGDRSARYILGEKAVVLDDSDMYDLIAKRHEEWKKRRRGKLEK